jgi:hypothetical protein
MMDVPQGGELRRSCVAAAILLLASALVLHAQETSTGPAATAQPATAEATGPAEPGEKSPAAGPSPSEPAQSEPTVGEDEPVAADKPDSSINFAVDVRPILTMHCLKCHDAKMHRGGLSLDSRAGAQRGGDSGQSLLGGTLETNPLYARVSSDERSFRMPKNAEALPAKDIETLRRWVEQGTPWPEPAPDTAGGWLKYLGPLASWLDRHQKEYQYATPYMIGFLLLQVLVLLALRCRAAYRQERAWTQGRLAPLCRLCDRVRGSEILLVSLLAFGVVAAAFFRGSYLKMQTDLATLTAAHKMDSNPWTSTVYGYPPMPVRPKQPKQVSGTYYRGNCERNEALFNGGNYLTSIFRVALCDRGENPLHPGDAIPADGLYIRCEIERGPGTADQLFSPEGMGSVLFTKQHIEATEGKQDEEPVHLEVLESGQRWAAVVPLGKPNATEVWSGVIYVYTGTYHEGRLAGTLHYGIGYKVSAVDGKVSPESDVWMDSFGNPAFAPPTPTDKLPYQEWFGTQPLPVITGENSTDPKLLGIDEHVRKGFIKPPSEPAVKTEEAVDAKRQPQPNSESPAKEQPAPDQTNADQSNADQTGPPADE